MSMVNHERYCSKSYIPICPDVPKTYPVTQRLYFDVHAGKGLLFVWGQVWWGGPYFYHWLLRGCFVRLIRSQKMSSVSNMACLTVLVSFQSLWCTEVRYCVENSNLSTPEFWWVLVSRQSLFGCMIRPQNMSSVSNMASCWRILKVLVSF